MARRKKRRTRQLSDFIVDYGVLPGPLDYESYVGLTMNSGRARHRQTYFQGLAYSTANSVGDVPYAIVRAACETDEEAQKLWFDINASRHRARMGW